MTPASPTAPSPGRPRVAGDREQEIFAATLRILEEVGYDRLTMDAVAAAARASKATLYRRWQGKASLVVDALQSVKTPTQTPDTGSLRDDLLLTFCGTGGLTDHQSVASFSSVLTAIFVDPEFAREFRERVIGPKSVLAREIFERARRRGELRDDVDLDLLAPALAGIVLHRLHVLGETPDADTIARVIDQIILPAALPPAPATRPTDDAGSTP